MTCDRCEALILPRQRKCRGCEKSVKQIRIDIAAAAAAAVAAAVVVVTR